jgi:hypothetical protein
MTYGGHDLCMVRRNLLREVTQTLVDTVLDSQQRASASNQLGIHV